MLDQKIVVKSCWSVFALHPSLTCFLQAEEVLKKMAASNGKVLPSGTLIATAESER